MTSKHPTIRSVLTLFLFAAVLGGLLLVPLSATAASIGPGYQQPGRPLNHLGGYLTAGGRVAYCIDAGKPSAVGHETSDSGSASSVNGLTPPEMLRLNSLLARHGDTTEANTAAAVALAVWSIAGDAAYQAEGGDVRLLTRAPADQRGSIQSLADQFRAESAAVTPLPPTASLSITIDEGDDYAGILALDASSPATGSVVLSNAVFTDTGVSTRASVPTGARVAILAAPPDGAAAYRVSATSADLAFPPTPDALVQVYSTAGAQTLVASAGSTTPVLSVSASDVRDRRVLSVTTVAQQSAVVGETVIDTAELLDVPTTGVQLTWAGYLQPVGSGAPLCTADTLVFESAEEVTVRSNGVIASEPFAVTDGSVGTVFWVATVTRDHSTVAQGNCGDSAETTVISALAVPVHLPVVSG